jgi:hypothetical protein
LTETQEDLLEIPHIRSIFFQSKNLTKLLDHALNNRGQTKKTFLTLSEQFNDKSSMAKALLNIHNVLPKLLKLREREIEDVACR